MKKQILFLAMFTMALIFAGTNNVFAQVCTPSATNPNAGVEYTYSTTLAGTQPNYDWYVTKNTNVLSGILTLPSTLFTVASSTPYNDASTGVNNIKITWTAAAIADGGPFYLVLRYSEKSVVDPDPNCRVENLRVIEIKPINTFLLAFEGGMLSGTDYAPTASSNVCAAGITAAVVTPAATPSLLLTYGQNTLYYVATASGIIGDWYPQIRIPALVAASGQVYVSADWTSDMKGAGGWQSFGAATTSAQQDLLSTTPATASVAGTPILIRIVIDNVNYENLGNQTITLALDGFLPPTPIVPATSKSDITSLTDCNPLAPFGRTATVTINKRPNVTTVPPAITVTN